MSVASHLSGTWWGCTLTYLANFPYDSDGAYNKKQLNDLKTQIENDIPKAGGGYTRCWVAVLCSQQQKAKKILEDAGFKMLLETKSGHPEEPEGKQCNGGMIYLMWKEVPQSDYQK